jgi:hypothetical protein
LSSRIAPDPAGTVYLTVGAVGALTDDVSGDWFTAATYEQWTPSAQADSMATYVKVHVDGSTARGEVYTLGTGTTPVDTF